MPRSRNVHVALLRGINVGKAKRIAMADLKNLVGALGYHDVRTILNSGNVVYAADRGTARQSASRIEKTLISKVGIASKVTGLTAAELNGIIESNPLPEAVETPSRFLVAITGHPAVLSDLAPLASGDWKTERLALGKSAAYMWSPAGLAESELVEAVARILGDKATTRNWATLNRIAAVAKEVADRTE